MITGTAHVNGIVKLKLTGENLLDEEILKALDKGTVSISRDDSTISSPVKGTVVLNIEQKNDKPIAVQATRIYPIGFGIEITVPVASYSFSLPDVKALHDELEKAIKSMSK